MRSYRDLDVWQDAMTVAERIYAVTAVFPTEERYGIVQQMRRATVSISSNIAEGYGRRTARQRYNFLENALGSTFELETQIELSSRLGFLHATDSVALAEMIATIGRRLTALMRHVKKQAEEERPRFK